MHKKWLNFFSKSIEIERHHQDYFKWPISYTDKNRLIRMVIFLLEEFRMLFLILCAVLAVIIVRLLRPIVLIRFRQVSGKRIGQLALEIELYLSERDVGMHNLKTYDIFYFTLPFSNYQLKKMWQRKIHMAYSSRFIHQLCRLNNLFPGHEQFAIPLFSRGCRDIHGLYARTQPHLSFTRKEEGKGAKALREMGIPKNTPFVCFHVRDSAYLESLFPHTDWEYHRYRDASIKNYIPAIEELTKQGYFVLRMGAKVKEPLITDNPMIIDYASKYRTDFLDIYLCAKCKFFIASNAGIEEVPKAFRRPILYLNFSPFECIPTWWPVILFIPKKYWLEKENRFLTFSEVLNSKINRTLWGHDFKELGIDVIENTPNEILSAVIEMDKRLKGEWQTSSEDEGLQYRFRSLLNGSDLHGKITARVATEFLRQNRNFLS